MPDRARLRRLLAGVLSPGTEAAPLSDEERRQMVRRAVMDVYARAHPRPPLDRLVPAERARFRP